jgi:hypothetical protein
MSTMTSVTTDMTPFQTNFLLVNVGVEGCVRTWGYASRSLASKFKAVAVVLPKEDLVLYRL